MRRIADEEFGGFLTIGGFGVKKVKTSARSAPLPPEGGRGVAIL